MRALAKWDTVDAKLVEVRSAFLYLIGLPAYLFINDSSPLLCLSLQEWFSMTKQAAEMSLPELLAIEADKAANA